MVRLLVALVFVAVSIVVIAGSPPNKEKGPPRQIEEDVPEDKISVRDQILVGDMILPRDRFRKTAKNTRAKRMAFGTDYKWPKAGDTVTIPYTESGVDSDVIGRAIEVFNAKTCIRFVPRVSQPNYVAFQTGSGCSAVIGDQESIGRHEHPCTLTSSCAGKKGKVLHEMMHILGFLHEQCRPDRDSYVTIHTDNIISGAADQFAIENTHIDQGIAYDCDSILQYKATAFATSSSVSTISSPNGYCTAFGNDDTRLSLKDFKRVNTLYGCDPNPNYRYFTVRVVTRTDSWYWPAGSGTDCHIYMKLHGSQRTSSEFELDLDDAGSSNLFENSSDDTFSKMAYRDDLGTITGISIRMVSHGSGPAWWPTKFIVTDPVNSNEHTFTNANWLSPSSTYGTSSFPAA